MRTYSELNYIVHPRYECQAIEIAFALTANEIVRRVTDRTSGVTYYSVADLYDMTGRFEPKSRNPSVTVDAWTSVAGSDETPI